MSWAKAAAKISSLEPADFFRRWSALESPADQDESLRLRFRYREGEFLRYCFPEVFSCSWDPFHLAVLNDAKLHWSEFTHTTRSLNLAPRGVGKSTVKKGDVAHSIVYGLRRFIIVVGATQPDAKGWAATLREWFGPKNDGNRALWELYGPFELKGEKQRFTVTCPRGSTTILCASVNTSLQGENELTHRPDELILDDWEDRKKVRSETTRRSWERKLKEEMLKLGDRTRGLAVEACVTVNHPEQPSAKIRRGDEGFRGWEVREFQAIVSWPERMDLWNKAGSLFNDLTLGSVEIRRQCAFAFYQANKEEMDRGAELLDTVLLPLFACFEAIWAEGMTAFLREFQHKTRAPGEHLFDSTRFARCRVVYDKLDGLVVIAADGRRVLAKDCHRKVGRWDPATGVQGGDNGALAVVLRDKYGYGFVVDCWRKNAPVSIQLEAMWMLAEKWGLTLFSLESNGFQATLELEFRRQRDERREAGKFWQLRLELDPSSGNKEDRLSSLEAPIAGDILQFAEHLDPEVQGEFDEFDGIPNSHKDDAHDAIEGAWARSGGQKPRMARERVR